MRGQVAHLGTVVGRPVERERGRLFVGQRQVEAIAEFDQVDALELLLRVRRHAPLAGAAHAVALLGVREHDGRLAAVRGRRGIRRVDLHEVVAAALQAIDLLIGHALGEALEFVVLAEEVVAVEAAVFRGEGLHLAVDRVRERARECAGCVARKEAIPIAAPDQLDDVPAGAGEQLFELVDDAAVAAHRAVEALQVAVDDPDEVVERFARGQGQCTHRFGLVHLAVAEHAPDLSIAAIEQAAVGEVAHETRVVDRADRPDAHRAGRELPEVGHQGRMRVAAEAAGAFRRAEFLSVVRQVVFAQPAFEVGACVHAWRAVRLEEDQIAAVCRGASTEEMVEAGLEQIGRARVAGDVATELTVGVVRAHHHRECVPAHQRGQALLDRQIARERRLRVDRDRVDIGRGELGCPADALLAGQLGQPVEDLLGALRAVGLDQRREGVAPLFGFDRIGVGHRVHPGTVDRRAAPRRRRSIVSAC